MDLIKSSEDSRSSLQELNRQLTICNACRYCEGYCAVFPAMSRHKEFLQPDMQYLANLCHSCGSCLHACQYAPPHEFGVNIPNVMARVRIDTYREFAWPGFLARLYDRNALAIVLFSIVSLSLFFILSVDESGMLLKHVEGGDFYSIIPHNRMVFMFGAVFGFSLLAISVSLVRFWKSISTTLEAGIANGSSLYKPIADIATLKNLGGGHGQGCNNADDAYTLARRRYHHFTFYGFILCFAATSVATIYHYVLGWPAPYDLFSLPKLLGISGGAALLVGTVGLFYLSLTRHVEHGDAKQKPMDRGFILLLFMISLTGLLLFMLRETTLMPLMLSLHLGVVMAFFLLMPYSKFMHGFYRGLALVKCSQEGR